MAEHESVLKNEVLEQLHIKEDGVYVDCTLGRAGHATEIANRLGDAGLLIGFDQDDTAIKAAKEILPKHNTILIHANFRHLKKELQRRNIDEVDGFLFDLGVSSPQLDEAERGFSYHQEARLDMRMDRRQSLSAYHIVNEWSMKDLADMIYAYGEERFSRQIARLIVQERKNKPIETTLELVDIIKRAIPAPARRKGGHPAKRTFQALRIAVNDELSSFTEALQDAAEMLAIEGRIAVITFHSLEDRICKQSFRKWSTPIQVPRGLPIVPDDHEPPFTLITRRPILPTEEELARNRRARSAKLRVAKKVAQWDERFRFKERWKTV